MTLCHVYCENIQSTLFQYVPRRESGEKQCLCPGGGWSCRSDKPAALLRWTVAGPEMDRAVTEFLDGLDKTNKDAETYHHEDHPVMIYK